MATMTYTGTLVVTSCWCGINMAIPDDLYKIAKRDHSHNVYCPLGHSFVYTGETEAEKERRLRKYAEDQAVAERARADGAEASLRATKGHVTRLRNAALAGNCPICGKHVYQLARHMGRAHKDEHPEPES